MKALIEQHGGKNASSKQTSLLLSGDKIGPSKLAKAEKLGVKVVSEEEFLGMVDMGA